MKQIIVKILKNVFDKEGIKLEDKEILDKIEVPPSSELGDYAFPCFFLAGILKKSPTEIASKIGNKISSKDFRAETKGGYINFFVNKGKFAEKVIDEILEEKDNFGSSDEGKNKTIIVEFSSPNIAKPFGIGHLRSTIIGNSIANILKFEGFKIVKMNYLGDWGTQFGKLLFGFKKFGSEEKLKEDAIKHLLEIYVKVNKDEKYEEPSREWFKKLENGDKEAEKLWNRFKDLSMKEFEKIYSELGIKFDVYSGESLFNKKINMVVEQLKKKNLVEESEGALIVDLKKYGLGVCLIQKSDGTTIYAARDLAAAISRHEEYKFDKMIYEVGQEQKLHFAQVFKVLELAGYKWAKNLVHAEHGLYLDKDGKKFSTRKGKTVFIEDILNETKQLASKEIVRHFPNLAKKEIEERAKKIAKAAIFYGDLKNNRTNNIVFDIDRFVSFDGDTGPYILYSYARASSILKKVKDKAKMNVKELNSQEFELVKKLAQFKEVIANASENMSPPAIANYSYQLAQLFNEFYHVCPVIGSENELFRIELVKAFKQVLKNALNLLGIDAVEEM